MKVRDIMERAGISQTGLALALIKDGLSEIELVAAENVTQYTTDLTKDQSTYNLPSNLVEVTGVKIKDSDSGYFCPISRTIIEDYKEK